MPWHPCPAFGRRSGCRELSRMTFRIRTNRGVSFLRFNKDTILEGFCFLSGFPLSEGSGRKGRQACQEDCGITPSARCYCHADFCRKSLLTGAERNGLVSDRICFYSAVKRSLPESKSNIQLAFRGQGENCRTVWAFHIKYTNRTVRKHSISRYKPLPALPEGVSYTEL